MSNRYYPAGKKLCPECRQIKGLDKFSPTHKSDPDGKLQSKCKPCNSVCRTLYQAEKRAAESAALAEARL